MPTWLLWTLGIGIPLTAAAVPIIIHLINLTRYRRVDWAAMEFLLAAYKKTRRRLQMESLIMLLLRVLAVMLIAAALFPMGCERAKEWADESLGLTKGTLATDAPLHLVLVLDNSASMGYKQENQTAFDRAKQFSLATVDSLQPNRDRVSVVRLSDVYVPPAVGGNAPADDEAEKSRRRRVRQLSGLNLDAARREIAATGVASVDTNILAAMREAVRLVESTPEGDAAGLVIVSDFSNAGWLEVSKNGTVHADFLSVMQRAHERMKPAGTTPIFYDAGFENAQNVAITGLRVDERIIGNGMEAKVLVEMQYSSNDTRAQPRRVRLKYRIDGGPERPVQQVIDVVPNTRIEPVQLILPARELALKPDEEKSGASRNIEVFTEEPDALTADNTRNLVIHVVPGVPILVINGVPHPDPTLDETFYLETALGISSSRIEGERGEGTETRITPNQIVSMRPEQMAQIDTFLDYRLVILANVQDVPEGVVGKLEEFVAAGFGLVVFDGPRVDFGKYNSLLYKDGKGLLPGKLGRPGGSDDPGAASYGLAVASSDHPVIRVFSDTPENLTIITNPAAVRNWREVTLPQGDEADPLRPVQALLNLNLPEPKPLVLERAFGRGRVMYVATTASERWNTLWSAGDGLPLFLYLEVASYLTGNEARYSNLAVGEPYVRVLRVVDIAPRYTVRDPAGTTVDLVPTGDAGLKLLEFAGTAQTGVYTLTAFENTDSGEPRRKWQERFSVNMQGRESDLTRLSAEGGVEGALKEAMGDVPMVFRRVGDELEGGGALTGEKGKREWLWLAALGVCFLLFETLWSGVISKPEA